ncbi:hypothetical protein DFH09DRAFT_1082908 [Mycena vulgaris]|nr:hypothetical protein DFH09DRAFT_1082908 [Mycena vulgaris]
MCFDELAAPEPEENFLEGWILWACDHPLSLTIHADVVACFEKPRLAELIRELAPRAQNLHLWGSWNYTPFSIAAVSWTQLTKFSGKLSSLSDCLKLLWQAESLVECSISVDIYMTDVDTSATHTPCLHPCLSQLSLVVCNASLHVIPGLLPLLTLPALHTFQLDQYDKSLIDFLNRHSSHLRDLPVEHPAVKSFPPLPALTTLKTYPSSERDAEFTGVLFGRLEDPETRCLPSIQHIILPTFDSLNPTDFAIMGRALSSRWNRHHSNSPADVAEIRSLTLDIGLAGEKTIACFEEVLSPLTGLKAGGVDIRVDIGTWFPLSDSNDADLADDGSDDSGDDDSNGSEGDGSNVSEGDGSDDSDDSEYCICY